MHACYECGELFQSKQSLALHQFKAHAVVREFRDKTNTEFCACCLSRMLSKLSNGKLQNRRIDICVLIAFCSAYVCAYMWWLWPIRAT